MKLFKQISAIAGVLAMFLLFDLGMGATFTARLVNDTPPEMQAKSVIVSEYLPFTEQSKIVKTTSANLQLTSDLPVMDGAAALFPVFSAFCNAVYPADSVHYDSASGDFTKNSALQYVNTRGAYQKIVDGGADIIFCAKPSESQLAYAAEKGVELQLTPIGKEAFVFIVNEKNPIETLTQEQIRAIYSGKITNWKQVGGANRLIEPLRRNEGSGSQTAMENFMQGEAFKHPLFGALGGSIGFSFRYYVEGIVGNGGVKMISVDGVYPNIENIKSGEYPIVSSIYAVTRKGEQNKNVSKLLDWILSDEGQSIIEKSGYVGV